MITNADYNSPLGIPRGYFNGTAVPVFPDFLTVYHVHFMRYIYYMCIMNAEGNYPNELSIEEILKGFELNKGKKCKPRIKKILIGEAPPPNPINYLGDVMFNNYYNKTWTLKELVFIKGNRILL